MGRGSRHSKNAGVMGSEALTYWERKALGYGDAVERLGKDSQGRYFDCSLTLQPVKDPVCCPNGHLYSRSAVIEYLVNSRKAKKKALEAWEKQRAAQSKLDSDKNMVKQQMELVSFDRQNHQAASSRLTTELASGFQQVADGLDGYKGTTSVQNIKDYEMRMKDMKAFWMPQEAENKQKLLDKPSKDVTCVRCNAVLQLKTLIKVKFTDCPQADDTSPYMDPITRQTFKDGNKLVVLKPTGDVMLKSTYEKFVKDSGEYDGAKIKSKHVINLQRGGTGFAANDENAEAKKYFSLGPGSGNTDLRGQHRGSTSLGGLRFMN